VNNCGQTISCGTCADICPSTGICNPTTGICTCTCVGGVQPADALHPEIAPCLPQ
jgi:hypothetical protein